MKVTTIRRGSSWACGLLTNFAVIALTQTAVSAPVVNPANGHYYEVIASGEITWYNAYLAATASTYLGNSGYLATITSSSEDSFVAGLVGGGQYWIGGYQAAWGAEPGGGWTWDTTEPWSYTGWAPGEPSDGGGGEDFLTMFPSWGGWNTEDDEIGCPTHGAISGYIVEYGGVTGYLGQPLGGGICEGGGGGGAIPTLGAPGGVLLLLSLAGLGAWLVRRRASRRH